MRRRTRERLIFPISDPKWPMLPEVSRRISYYYDKLAWVEILNSVDPHMLAVLRSGEQICVLCEIYSVINLGVRTDAKLQLGAQGGIVATKMIRSAHHNLYYFYMDLAWGSRDGVVYALAGCHGHARNNWVHIKKDQSMGSPFRLMEKLEAVRVLYLRLFRLWAGQLQVWKKLRSGIK